MAEEDTKKNVKAYPQPKEVIELDWWNTTQERIVAANRIWSPTFDEDAVMGGYVAPQRCVEIFNIHATKYFPGKERELRILDVGCGTGLVGENLNKHGYSNIDALDVTDSMLEKAKSKNIYTKLICAFVTNERIDDIEDKSYDVMISSAAITPGQIKPHAFNEILRWIKKGGLLCFTCRKDAYENPEFGYQEKFAQLERDKRWELISNTEADYYINQAAEEFSHSRTYMLVYRVL